MGACLVAVLAATGCGDDDSPSPEPEPAGAQQDSEPRPLDRVVKIGEGHPAERRNVKDQRGWLVLSSRAEQVVVDTGHDVINDDPELAIDLLLDTVKAAR